MYPCIAMGPTAAIANRIIVPDTKEQELIKLREENKELRRLLDSQLGKTQESK